MACDQQTLVMISTYSDGEASPQEAFEAKAHLEQCVECRKLLQDWRSQRTMFEWTYDTTLPEDEPAQAWEIDMHNSERIQRPRFRLSIGWNWARVGALAAALVIAFVVYRFATMPPMLGSRLVTKLKSQKVRVASDIDLKVGPDTEIARVDAKSIRLVRGWVSASVRHGSGFRVVTKRVEVTDQGTRFQVVTGPMLDYVSVEEGSVVVSRGKSLHKVTAGHVLMAQDKGDPLVAPLPEAKDWETRDSVIRLGQMKERVSEPRSGREMDWDEALEKLAPRFPSAPLQGMEGSGSSGPEHGLEFRYSFSVCPGLTNGLREHFADIAQAASGGRIDSASWELPVCGLMVDGIASTPELPADIYYVRLVCEDGILKWRLSGAMGNDADFPFAFGGPNKNQANVSQSGWDYSIEYSAPRNGGDREFSIRLSGWPGELEPKLQLTLRGVRTSEVRKDEQALLADVTRIFPETNGVKFDSPNVLYLDKERKHWFLIVWNNEAGKILFRIPQLAKQKRGASVTLGAIATDRPLQSPSSKPGAYLLRFVQPPLSGTPRIELVTQDGRSVAMLTSLAVGIPRHGGGSVHGSTLHGSGNAMVMPVYLTNPANRGSFLFGFRLCGKDTGDIWAEGWIRVREP